MVLENDGTFDSLGTLLSNTTFVIVDLETNGKSPAEGGITEIGAVKVCGGEILSEFQTLVNPGSPIPPFITLLTGINDAMVADAPNISFALPAFLEWAGDCVFVAHNAGFDLGFLRASAKNLEIKFPAHRVLDTLTLARCILHPDEVPNRKLGTLAAHFGSPTDPVHRALADARATAHVMHALFERLGSFGVTTLEETLEITTVIKPAQRKKRNLASDLPEVTGVYAFRDDQDRVLYIGKSRNIRKRAMSYFTKAETRSRMNRMLDLTHHISAIPCHTDLEASIREARIILQSKPPFNAAGKRAEKAIWIRITNEPYPRLSVVRKLNSDSFHFGPLRSMEQATLVVDAITTVIGIRTCIAKLSVRKPSPSCALGEMGRCTKPCELSISTDQYRELIDKLISAINGQPLIEDSLKRRITQLASEERFEEAAIMRDRLHAWLAACIRYQKLKTICESSELIAYSPAESGYDLHLFRYGALAAAGKAKELHQIPAQVLAMKSTAQEFLPPTSPAGTNSISESFMIYSWLFSENVVLMESSEGLAQNWPNQLSETKTLEELNTAQNKSGAVTPLRKWQNFVAPK
ncbi:MAG: polymerase subunit epsilon [Actinomycetota bacterium]